MLSDKTEVNGESWETLRVRIMVQYFNFNYSKSEDLSDLDKRIIDKLVEVQKE